VKQQWVRVTRSAPCVVCSHVDYCTRSAGGMVARCMRIESDHPCEKGGWIHRLSEPLPRVEIPDKPPRPKRDAAVIAKACCANPRAAAKRQAVASKLGVSVAALEDLGVGIGYDEWNGHEWASFPSRGVNGEIVGITRRYDDGTKKTLAGTSNAGIFCKPFWYLGSGTVYIVEGASDVAAMLDAGLCVLGRPSNVGGIVVLTAYMRRHPMRVVVVGENDAKPERRGTVEQCKQDCRGCSWCWPGKSGMIATADRLARALRQKVEVVMPPERFKDVRQWWIGNQLAELEAAGIQPAERKDA